MPLKVDWPAVEDEDNGMKMTDFFAASFPAQEEGEGDELSNWYGRRVAEGVF